MTSYVPKNFFFDSEKVNAAVDAATRKALIPIGAEIRTKAKRSMRPARHLSKSEITPDIAEQMGLDRDNYRDQLKNYTKSQLPYKSSNPGEPPRTRKSKRVRNLLFFGWDPITKSVVAGPTPLGESKAPHDLEHGGVTTITIRKRKRPRFKSTPRQRKGLEQARASGKVRSRRTSGRRPGSVTVIKKRVRIRKRPFMLPQLTAILPKIPSQFQGLVR